MKQPLDRKDFTIVVQPLMADTQIPSCSSVSFVKFTVGNERV